MDQFIELRFGQGQEIQREIIPVSSIKSVYVELPEKTSIVFIWKSGKFEYKRIEYYATTDNCDTRWSQIREILTGKVPTGYPLSDYAYEKVHKHE